VYEQKSKNKRWTPMSSCGCCKMHKWPLTSL
jgi:hypothetical protein